MRRKFVKTFKCSLGSQTRDYYGCEFHAECCFYDFTDSTTGRGGDGKKCKNTAHAVIAYIRHRDFILFFLGFKFVINVMIDTDCRVQYLNGNSGRPEHQCR